MIYQMMNFQLLLSFVSLKVRNTRTNFVTSVITDSLPLGNSLCYFLSFKYDSVKPQSNYQCLNKICEQLGEDPRRTQILVHH